MYKSLPCTTIEANTIPRCKNRSGVYRVKNI